MKTIEISQATAPLAEYAQTVDKETLILTINGEPVAALVSIHDVDLETIKLSTDPRFLSLIEQSRTRQQQEGGLSSAEMRRRLGLK